MAANQWLLVHPDLRTIARVRLVIDWLRATFKAGKRALEGRRPPRGSR